MAIFSLNELYLLITILINISCIEDYVVYHPNNNYPKPLLLPNNEVLGFSGLVGKVTRFTQYGTIIRETPLPFNYEDNACIKVLNGFPEEKFVIASHSGSSNQITLQIFNETKAYTPMILNTSLGSFLIDITLLSDGNILMNYIANGKIIIKKYILNKENLQFTIDKTHDTIKAENKYITCIEINTSKIMCTYVLNDCNDHYVLLNSDFSHLETQSLKAGNGCGYSKIININTEWGDNNKFAYCAVKQTTYFQCQLGSQSGNSVLFHNGFQNVITNCLENAKKTDLATFDTGTFVVACLKQGQKGIIVAKVTIDSNYILTSKLFDYGDEFQILEYPFVTKFGKDFISVFYARKTVDNKYNDVYQILGVPFCNDINSTNNTVFIEKETIITITDYISYNTSTAGELKYKFESIPDTIQLLLYNVSEKTEKAQTGNEYNYKYLKLIAGPEPQDYTMNFWGIHNDAEGKHCSIFFKVKPCFEGCKTCKELGTNIDNKCEGCKDGFGQIMEDNTQCKNINETLNDYYFDKDKKKWLPCFERCKTCTGPKIDEKQHQCINCKSEYAKLIGTTNCITKGEVPPQHFPSEDDDKNPVYKPCYETCDTCEAEGDDSNHNCTTCLSDSYFKETTKVCLKDPEDGYYLNKTPTPPIFKRCNLNCETCIETATKCLSCSDSKFLLENTCVSSCESKYYADESNRKCVNCHPKFKPLNENICLDRKPDDTFISDSKNNVIEPCYDLCSKCNDIKYTSDNQQCKECKDPSKYILEETNCICNSNHVQEGSTCINCKDRGEFKYSDGLICTSPKPDGTYVSDDKYNIIEKCYDTCLTCSSGYDSKSGNHNCDKCKEGKINDPSNKLNCISGCNLTKYNWYIDPITKEYKCTEDKTCNGAPGQNLNEKTSECKISCEPDYAYNATCYEKCPSDTIPDNITFKCNVRPPSTAMCNYNQLESSSVILGSNEEIKQALNDLVKQYISKYGTIANNIDWISVTENFKVRVLKSDQCNYDFCYDSIINSSSSIPSDFAYFNITQCQKILQGERKLPLITDVIFIMVDSRSSNGKTSSLDYIAYSSPMGIQLDLQSCKGMNNSISYPFDEFDNKGNGNGNEDNNTTEDLFKLAEEMQNKGIDIFNPEDPFFNDFCEPYYTEDGKDVILLDRRKDFFKNVTLCEQGCNYTRIDYSTKKIECSCDIKDQFLNNNPITPIELPGFGELDSSNIIVVKCYNLVFNLIYFKVNFGSWILLLLLAALLIFDIVFRVKSFPQVVYRVNEVIKPKSPPSANPPKKPSEVNNSNNNLSKIPSESPSDMLSKHSQNIPSFELNNKESLSVNELSNINFEKPKLSSQEDSGVDISNSNQSSAKSLQSKENSKSSILSPSLDDLMFKDAVVQDKRGLLMFLWNTIKRMVFGLNLCFNLTLFEPFTLRFIGFIFHISVFLALNALLFNDQLISDRYNESKQTTLKELLNSIYVALICLVVGILISWCLSFNKRFSKALHMKKTNRNKEKYNKNIQKTTKSFKCSLWIFYLVTFIFMIFFWYYVSAFCAVYQKTQIPWLISSIISFVFIVVFQIILALILGCLRWISLRLKCKVCFMICNCLI